MTDPGPNYDQLWKDVITELFEEFLLFFSPDLFEEVDFSSPPEFLEQELQHILPDSESNNRVADKLVKLQLINGREQWVFVHVEVQGSYERTFPKRMFQYFYRIKDRFDKQVYALAIFTSESSFYNIDEYFYEFFGTSLTYRYNTFAIASQSEDLLLQSNNPFALAVLAGYYVIKSKKEISLKYQYKRKLMSLLLQDKIMGKDIKREYIQKLLIFIDHILKLPEDFEETLIRELKPIIEKEATAMALSLENTSFAKYYRKEGKAEGRAEGIIQGKKEGRAEGEKQKAKEIARNLLQMSMDKKSVCKVTGLTMDEVNKIEK